MGGALPSTGGRARRPSHRGWVQRLALQLPGSMDVLLRDFRLKLGRLGLGHLHAVERPHHLDFPLCRQPFRGHRGQSEEKIQSSTAQARQGDSRYQDQD